MDFEQMVMFLTTLSQDVNSDKLLTTISRMEKKIKKGNYAIIKQIKQEFVESGSPDPFAKDVI